MFGSLGERGGSTKYSVLSMEEFQRAAREPVTTHSSGQKTARSFRSSGADRRSPRRAVAARMSARWAAEKKRPLLAVRCQRRWIVPGSSSANWHRSLRRGWQKPALQRRGGSTTCQRSKPTRSGFPPRQNDSTMARREWISSDSCSNYIWRLSCRREVRPADRWRGTVLRGAHRHRYKRCAATCRTRTRESGPARIVADR
jgi:hypothetical protein